jgi:SAM-dependent methyltransferase
MEPSRSAKPSVSMRTGVIGGLALALGAATTALWIGGVDVPELEHQLVRPPTFGALLVCSGLTSANLLLRWSRWHFLLRRRTPELGTRDSLAVYLATLPALLSPFLVGELVRIYLVRRRFQVSASHLLTIWVTERYCDFAVLASALALTYSLALGAAVAAGLGLGALLLFLRLFGEGTADPHRPSFRGARGAVVALVTTIAAWSLVVLCLYWVCDILGRPIDIANSVRAFSGGTLLGGASGLPLGISVTGSVMITTLTAAGVPSPEAVLAVLVVRSGTAWYAVGIGLVALAAFRERLVRLVRGHSSAHFDELSPEYAGEIPTHVRDRLLARKIAAMRERLAAHGIADGARGLDVGCGQGWYLAAMIGAGYRMDAIEHSAGQLEHARRHLEAEGLAAGLARADARKLPAEGGTYDFAYSINVLHHITSRDGQREALSEIVRTLRPGGIFLLHEMNTENPLFRWYMGYLFPLLKRIDEGTEEWILPTRLPPIPGATWLVAENRYFTFLPDFVPGWALRLLRPLEARLEGSSWAPFSAHYQAVLAKDR